MVLDIPEKIQNWNIDTINELIKYKDVESERLDFKSEINELYDHICAMANTSGGFLVIGIKEIKSADGKSIIKLEKKGFKDGEQDSVKTQIGNSCYNIEPNPSVRVETISDDELFYPVIKIENEISKKPFFIKGKSQCFVRIDNSTRPASRTTIMNLFGNSIEIKNNIERLRVSALILKESIMHVSSDASNLRWDSPMKITTINLDFIRDVVLITEKFLRENDLFGEHTGQSSYTGGINSILYRLETFNTYAQAYNLAQDNENRRLMCGQMMSWGTGSHNVNDTITFLDKIDTICKEFLNKYN